MLACMLGYMHACVRVCFQLGVTCYVTIKLCNNIHCTRIFIVVLEVVCHIKHVLLSYLNFFIMWNKIVR